jgi:hypothetical protein
MIHRRVVSLLGISGEQDGYRAKFHSYHWSSAASLTTRACLLPVRQRSGVALAGVILRFGREWCGQSCSVRGELFLAGAQHGVWHNNSEIPSVYIQLGVCGKFNTVKAYYQYQKSV